MLTRNYKKILLITICFICSQFNDTKATTYNIDLTSAHEAGVIIIKLKSNMHEQCELHKINNQKLNDCLNGMQAFLKNFRFIKNP